MHHEEWINVERNWLEESALRLMILIFLENLFFLTNNELLDYIKQKKFQWEGCIMEEMCMEKVTWHHNNGVIIILDITKKDMWHNQWKLKEWFFFQDAVFLPIHQTKQKKCLTVIFHDLNNHVIWKPKLGWRIKNFSAFNNMLLLHELHK